MHIINLSMNAIAVYHMYCIYVEKMFVLIWVSISAVLIMECIDYTNKHRCHEWLIEERHWAARNLWKHDHALLFALICHITLMVVSEIIHDDAIKWTYFPRYWPFVWGIHQSPVNSPHEGQRRGALMFSLIHAWTNGWVNNRDAGDWRRHSTHDDITVMSNWYSFI